MERLVLEQFKAWKNKDKRKPLLVKAVDNTKAKSLHQFCNRFHPKMAIKSSLKNVGDNMDGETHVWSLPLYTLFRFKEYLYREMGWE